MIGMAPPTSITVALPQSPASAWISGTSGLAFGGSQIARAGNEGELRYTVIPLPVQPPQDITMQSRADAVSASYTGWLQSAVDLYRLSVERNGFMTGTLDTMAHGLLGLPLAWLGGSEEMRSALQDIDGTPGDYARTHPKNECAKIFRDGVGLGFGLGQYVLMCWRCDSVEFDVVEGPGAARAEVCRTCAARRMDRPVGSRRLFQLRWRDARWLWRNPVTLQWYYTGRQGMVPVNPGDGEWFLFRTVPDQDIWTHGPWALGTEAAIFARDATYDRQNTSAVCAPTNVFNAKGNTDPKTRADVNAQADKMRFGNTLILPGEWEHEIHSASADYVDVADGIVNWASDQWEVAITGNRMGQQSGTGFANMDVYMRSTRERRTFYAGAWIQQVVEQGLAWWGLDNFGTRLVPRGTYDVRSPEDKLAESKALEAEGSALKSLRDGFDAVGYELEPAWVEERAQQKGVRVKAKLAAFEGDLDDKSIPAIVKGSEARQRYGLQPFGDARDGLTVANLVGASQGKVTDPSSSVKPAAAPAAASAPAEGARVESEDAELDARRDPYDDHWDEDDEDVEARTELAAALTAHGYDSCEHGRKHACPRCGVQRGYGVGPRNSDGTASFRVTWRVMKQSARTMKSLVELAERSARGGVVVPER